MNVSIKKHRRKILCHSWVLYGIADNAIEKTQKLVDDIFSDYSYYPEIEWEYYNVFPPEGHQPLGAWRHKDSRAFSFLLDNPKMDNGKQFNQFLIYLIGEESEVSVIEPQILALKTYNSIKEDGKKEDYLLDRRLNRIQKSKSLSVLTAILGVYTAIINAFALYLKQLSLPPSWNHYLVSTIEIFISLFWIVAIFLLIVFVLILVIFIIKYGILLIKRL
jgi:hypothetical protein